MPKILFEIHAYEYELPKPGAFTLEAYLNYAGLGTKTFDGLGTTHQKNARQQQRHRKR